VITRNRTVRRTAAWLSLALVTSVLALAAATPASAAPVAVPAPAVRITEFSYQLRDFAEAEFVELTNVGTTPVNLDGWSFDDADGVVGAFSLTGFGVVAPGESVVFTDVTPEAFRTYWGLAPTVKVVGGSKQGLGNGDQINIWDDAGVLVDRLTYDDTPRSRDNTVVPTTVAALGANTYDSWELSNATNDPGSITVDQISGAPASVGSPGTSEYAAAALAGPEVPIRITEFSYQLRDFGEAEFVELTNVGSTAVNLAGWSYSDSTTPAGTFDLSGLGVVAPGESVVFTDVAAPAFRTYWGLCSAVKVLGGSAPGLGNGDQINLWDDAANLVDRVTYGTTPRSRDNSVVPTGASVLAADDYTGWELSNATNDPGSITVDEIPGAPTSVGSPGTSEFATVAFEPACPPPPGGGGIDLSTYGIVGRYPLPTNLDTPGTPAGSELATEVSAVTYNWDTDTLFVVGDEGTSVVQVSTTGQLVDSMTLAAGEFEDTEGLTYVGGGQFVLAEERLRQAVLFTYEGGGVLTDSETQAVKLGTTIGNIGLEGISYDPLSSDASGLGFIGVKESGPLGLFQTTIDFDAGTASNGSPATENSTNLFDPALVGTTDLSDVFPVSLLPDVDGGTSENLLIISQESGRIVNIDRSGAIANQLDIVDVGGPLTVPAQTMEGITVDRDGIMYTTAEGGGGDATHPQLLVWAPDADPAARLAVTEVAPWGSDTTYGADWFELTNTGGTTLDLTGVKVDDGSNSAASAAALTGVASLAPGEAAVFFELAAAADPAAVRAAFELAWFGEDGAPAELQIGTYTGTGLGLSGTSGDAVNLFAADGDRLTGVSFGAATPQVTFDNTARVGAVAAPVAISTLASEGTNGAFVGADGLGLGSPGNVDPPTPPVGDTSGIRITEVAPWGSGNGPYAADWIEVTNTGTESVSLAGWRFDDSSALLASSVELVGVPTLPAGASALFFEGTDDAAFELAFAQAWFGQNLFDGGTFFGHYTGGGVGMSTGGDGATLFDSEGTLVTGVSFGPSPAAAPFATFDNAAGLGAAASPFPTLTTLSAAGTNGAFVAVDGHGVGSPGTAVLDVPVASAGAAFAAEGDEGLTDLVIPVLLSEPATTTVTVDWATGSPPVPTAGVDYVADSGTVTFLPGETEQLVAVSIIGDTIDEPGQAYGADWVGIELSNPSGAVFGDGELATLGFGLIVDDDPTPTIDIMSVAVTEGDAGTVELVLPVTLSNPSESTVTVDWTTFSGPEPTAGVDYEAASATVTFLPGETEKTVIVTVYGDTLDEPGQLWGADWLAVALSNPTGATLGSDVAYGLIVDDDIDE
jgi:uncharacterized protein YjiK